MTYYTLEKSGGTKTILYSQSFKAINYTDMFSLLINTKKTTLIFPNSQQLWAFFSIAELSEFRIDSSKYAFTGKLQANDIEIAKKRLGANEMLQETTGFKQNKKQCALNISQLLFATCNSILAALIFAINK
jgi:hypothetical protein